MTVRAIQREPDEETLRRAEYTYYEISKVSTYHDGRYAYVRLINKNSKVLTLNLHFFDIETYYI